MTITFDGIIEFLKVVPGILLFPFSFYFGYKKIGHSVGCKVSIRNSRVLGVYINSIVFQNYKDRPIAITEVFGIQNNVKFQIEEPKTPILLKGLETIVVKPEEYTKYVCKGERFEVDMKDIASLQIFVVTPEKTIPCKHIFRPDDELEKYHKGREVAHKITRRFNDVVYGEKSRFAIVHYDGKVSKTTTVDEHGFIDDSDLFGCSHIPVSNLTPTGIKAYLKDNTGMDVTAFELEHD
jgi:hypothetical protein